VATQDKKALTREVAMLKLARLLAVSALPFLFCEPANAQTAPASQIIQSPMLGVGHDQTFQLNVINFSSCTSELAILDSNGAVLRKLTGKSKSPNITFSYTPLTFIPTLHFPQRIELQAEVTFAPPPGTTAPCTAQATVEIYDNITHTDWVTAPLISQEVLVAFEQGQPDTPIIIGSVGLTAEQTARFSVVAHPPNPCIGTMGFIDTSANQLLPPTSVTLQPNQAISVDVSGEFVSNSALGGPRAEVIAVFTPTTSAGAPPGAAPLPNACLPALEVFDQFTGFTRVLILPGLPNAPAPGAPAGPPA
jgi:hypothetical protein